MGMFWLGVIFGWIIGELTLCFVMALRSDRADEPYRDELPRRIERDDRGERGCA